MLGLDHPNKDEIVSFELFLLGEDVLTTFEGDIAKPFEVVVDPVCCTNVWIFVKKKRVHQADVWALNGDLFECLDRLRVGWAV